MSESKELPTWMRNEPSPLPWRQSNNELGYENYDILASDGEYLPNLGIATLVDGRFSDLDMGTVALCREQLDINAKFIVKACNEYDALQAKLAIALDIFKKIDNPFEVWGYLSCVNYLQEIRLLAKEALAKLEEK